jgi:hypothetical protein
LEVVEMKGENKMDFGCVPYERSSLEVPGYGTQFSGGDSMVIIVAEEEKYSNLVPHNDALPETAKKIMNTIPWEWWRELNPTTDDQ